MPAGRYTGELSVKWLPGGRLMQLLAPFAFNDAAGLDWPVPTGATVDGASIPRALWSVVGGPFEGKYREASVVHDWYCAVRSRRWEAVHSMFYEAMLVSGVSGLQAKTLYLAVRYGGPRWDDLTIANTLLASGGKWSAPVPASPQVLRTGPVDTSEAIAGDPVPVVWRRDKPDADAFKALAAQVEGMSLAEIEHLADAQPGAIVAKAGN